MSNNADHLDQASEFTEAFNKSAVERALSKGQGPRLKPIGECHNCGDKLERNDQIFCDEECVNEYEYVRSRRKANA